MEKVVRLQTIVNSYKVNEETILSKIANGESELHSVPFLEGINVAFAVKSIYLEKDYAKARQDFYNAARVAEYLSAKYDSRMLDTGSNPISYALLSDNQELITRFSGLKNTINDETSIGYQLPNAIQNSFLENWDKLEWNIRCLERFVKFPNFQWYAPVLKVFVGILQKDEALIIIGLSELIKTHKKRNKDPLISQFFSVDTAGLTKLAWIKGYQINLNDSLVPQELMPVSPLTDYPDYDFLKL